MTPRAIFHRLLRPFGLAALAVLPALPAVTAGIGADDYFHRILLLAQ